MISLEQFERASRNPHFDFRSLLHILFPFPPQLAETCDEKSEKFHPLSLYYFRWAIGSSENLRVPDLELADRTFRARVLKNKHGRLKKQNTRVL